MAKLVTVYKTLVADAPRVMGYLEQRNLSPVPLDDVEQMGAYRNQAHEVRIAVPETQHQMALSVLAEMERQDQARIAPDVKVADGAMILVVFVGVLLVAVCALDPGGKWFYGILAVAGAVASVFIIRRAWRKGPRRP